MSSLFKKTSQCFFFLALQVRLNRTGNSAVGAWRTSGEKMLDLSFLTEEEYEKLVQVLQRDAELKRRDGDRIRRLQGSLKDEKKKKFVTGEWFYDVKAQRFQEELEGSDVLRASIKRKKSKTDCEANELARESLGGLEGPSPTGAATALPSPASEDGRSWEPALDSAEGPRTKPKPRLKLSDLPSQAEKQTSLEDVSPADSGVGASPFLATRDRSQVHGKVHEIQSVSFAKFSEKDLDYFPYSTGVDIPDTAAETPANQPVLYKETSASSKIPVRRKPSKESCPNTDTSYGAGKSELDPSERDPSLKNSKLPSRGWENGPRTSSDGHLVRQGANYTISSISGKDEETGLDREHFKNLKNFWEKGGESSSPNPMADKSFEKALAAEVNGRPPRLSRSLSVQSNQSHNGDERLVSAIPSKARVPYRRTATLSSSEDEPTYTAPPRKGSGSSVPRSTYGRSKGAAGNRTSLGDENGKQTLLDEEKKAPRCGRRSKLPVRVPSVKIEPAAKEQPGTIFEPETPADEFVMADESRRKADSLAGRVQILIEAASLEDLNEAACPTERSPDSGIQGDLEANGELLDEQPCSPTGDPLENGAVSNSGGAPPEMDSPGLSGVAEGDALPSQEIAKKLPRAQGSNLAKSMVNLYTTTETYTKPSMLTHQYLEPERVKDLSRSTPLLLSETESDTASEISFQFTRHKKSPSVGSHSSDMASVSSVSGSVLSVYSGDFGSVDTQGLVQFALDYDEKNREFQIYVSQCKDLAIVDEKKSRTDPYVKTYLLPDKARMGKRKTSVKKRTVSPIYNEVLRYKIEKMVLLIQKLNLSVWHNDPLGRNSFLGEMEIDLAGWDWRNNKLNWYMLKPRVSAVRQ
ncbi:hypothetical protein lerEdw1_014584 [Lerista edwardsae]|nr:hypothetical protein lerEdw1_014585 [Lerista edwardsae]KAJ6632939.1 hypothetical protein lerEdw1_014584 [Lerista edwardsae]